jgi:Component of IIS longevity pathway SMK-1
VAKIHQNFRVSFLKDVLLRPMMDDAVAATLNSVTYFNNGFIVKALHDESSNYIRRVFLKLKEPDLLQVGVTLLHVQCRCSSSTFGARHMCAARSNSAFEFDLSRITSCMGLL